MKHFTVLSLMALLAVPLFGSSRSAPFNVDTRVPKLILPDSGFVQGEVYFGWERAVLNVTGGVRADLFLDGAPYLSNQAGADSLLWDSATIGDGRHAAEVVFTFLEDGADAGRASDSFFVINDSNVLLHTESPISSEVWEAGKVHLVAGLLTIPSGVTITVEPGAIVKFVDDAGIIVADGGAFVTGTGAILTHWADDSVGGDTNGDGSGSGPVDEAYVLEGSGIINLDPGSELRYFGAEEVSGVLSTNTTLLGGRIYRITSDLTVPNSITLTILPGAILKFEPGVSLFVPSGGTVNALGNRDQPIILTSVKDDRYGGDTNGDGDASVPNAGDWARIYITGGTIDFAYVSVLYSSSVATAAGAIDMDGGSATLDGCIIAHSLYEAIGVDNATLNMKNSVIYDALVAVRHYPQQPLVNCVIYDVGEIVRGGGNSFYNCVIANFDTSPQWNATYRNCAFYNAPGEGPQHFNGVGSNGNIWAVPDFFNPERLDFRIRAGSALIDAGDGSLATMEDYFGQPRVDDPRILDTGSVATNGMIPDIGIYEVADFAQSDYDLAVDWVEGPENATVGESVVVSWQVRNVGLKTISETWHQKICFMGGAALGGQVVMVEEVLSSGTMATGETLEFEATVVMPALPEGEWYAQVLTNSNRDIFEGLYTGNNTGTASTVTTVTLPTLSVGSGEIISIPLGASTVRRLDLEAAQSATLRFDRSDMEVYVGAGFLPAENSHSYVALALENGSAVLDIPAHSEAGTFYVVFDANATSGDIRVDVEESVFGLLEVSPAALKNAGAVTLQLFGTGFVKGMTARLEGSASLQATRVEVSSRNQASATFNLTDVDPGVYDLQASLGGGNDDLLGAIQIEADGLGPVLSAELDIPEAVREGRAYIGWIVYENTGDADMLAPILTVESPTGVPMATEFASLSFDSPSEIKFMGIASTAPAGVLRPGEGGRIPFYFVGTRNVRIVLNSILAGEQPVDQATYFTDWADYHLAMSEMATRMNQRGAAEARVKKIHQTLIRGKRGQPVAAISGVLRHAITGEPLAGVELEAESLESGLTSGGVSDESGYFSLEWLPGEGDYAISSLDLTGIEPGEFSFPGAGEDLNNVVLAALPLGSISGFVYNQDLGGAIEGVLVTATDDDGDIYSAVTDSDGEYVIEQLLADTYEVSASYASNNYAMPVSGLVIDHIQPDRRADFAFKEGAIISGVITDVASGDPVVGAQVLSSAVDGITLSGVTESDGSYTIYGVAPGDYSVQVIAEGYQSSELVAVEDIVVRENRAFDLALQQAVPFYPLPAGGVGPLTVEFGFADITYATGYTYEWDFNEDGITDSTELTPSYTFNDTGDYTVSLTVSGGGESTTFTQVDCVEVIDPIPTVLHDHVLDVDADAAVSYVSLVGDVLVVDVNGSPSIPLEDGVVLMGTDGDFAYARRVISLASSGDRYTMETVQAGLLDIYVSLHIQEVLEVTGDSSPQAKAFEKVEGKSNKYVLRTSDTSNSSQEEDEEDNWELEGSVGFEVSASTTLRPVYDFEFRLEDRKIDMRCVFGPELEVSGSYSVFVKGAGRLKDELSKKLKGKSVQLPGVPLYFYPEFIVSAGLSGSFVGDLSYGASFRKTVGVKVGFVVEQNKVTPAFEAYGEEFFSPPEARFAANLNAKVYAKAEANLNLALGVTVGFLDIGTDISKLGVSISPYARASLKIYPHPRAVAAVGFNLDGEASLLDLRKFGIDWKAGLSKSYSSEYVFGEWKATTASFTASTTSGDAPLSVSFIDTSTFGEGGIEAWHWDFGDGSTSTAQNPTHTYEEEGVYEVSLITTGKQVTYAKPSEATITVGEEPEEEEQPTEEQKRPEDEKTSDNPRSFDPNEMAGPYGFGDPDTERFVQPGEWMDYIVYFENLPAAEAPAQEVWVTNPLSEWFDLSTFELGEVVFNNQTEMGLAGRQSGEIEVDQNNTDYRVRVNFELDRDTGEARWYLRSVDETTFDSWPADVLAGFLPPNDETNRGEGHLAYRVKLRDDVPLGTRIDNAASIVFDYNAAIPTDPAWFNTVATLAEISVSYNGADVSDGDTTPSTSDGTDFGSVVTASSSASRTFRVSNVGGSPLMLGTVTSSSDQFTVSGLNLSVAGGSYEDFTVTFTPSSVGTKTATISFSTNDNDENPFNFTVSGVGTEVDVLPPEISVGYNGTNIVDGDSSPSTGEGTDFGSQDFSSGSVVRTFRVSNTGESSLSLGAASSSSGEFSVSGLASSISGGSFGDFTVTFDPGSVGTKTATISFSTNDSDENPFNFDVSGVGTEVDVLPPEISVGYNGTNIVDGDSSPSTGEGTDFGSQDFSSGSVVRTFRVSNTGESTLTLGAASLSSGEFTVSGLASSISGGSFDDFTVTFDPGSVGTKTVTISFSTNDSDENPFNFDVSGVGTEVIVLTPAEISVGYNDTNIVDGDSSPSTGEGTAFGSQDFSSGSVVRTFRVSNTGESSLSLGAASSSSGEFSVSGLASSISGGSFDDFTVTFDPGSVGTKTATISFSTNDSDENPFNFTVSGVGTEVIVLTPAEISVGYNGTNIVDGDSSPSTGEGTAFGSQDFSSGSVVRTFRVSNTGESSLSLGAASSSSGEFSVSGLASSISGGSFDDFTVTFDPGSVGTKTVTISFSTNDSDENPFNFDVSGVGTEEPNSDPDGWLGGAADLGSGWIWLDWLGSINVVNEPWIYHLEHGWLYSFSVSRPESVFLWDNGMQSVTWTSETVYPAIYRFSDRKWIFYSLETRSPRWFVDLITGDWEQW